MAFKSLLLSKDADLVQNLARVLKDLDITVEPCSEPFAAAKRLMDQQFDAILVDCEDEQGAGWVLQSARMATASKKSVTIAIVGPQNANNGVRAGENFVIQKPIVLKQVEATLRAARGLMGDAGSGGVDPASSLANTKPTVPTPKLPAQVAANPQGRPPAELFDELSAALERLGPQASPARPVGMGTGSAGSAAAAAAPAREKVAPAAPERISEVEPAAPASVARSTEQAWPGLAAAPAPAAKPEAPAVLPLAATAAQMKPAARPLSEGAGAKDPFEEARGRMNAAAPAWSPGVEERLEAPAPSFSSFGSEEEPRRGFSFKSVVIVLVLISLALFGYSWYRGKSRASVASDQGQAPAAVPQQQAQAQFDNAAPVTPLAAANSGQSDSAESQPAAKAANAEEKAVPVPAKKSSEIIAPDTTNEVGLPPAPLVVKGGQHSANVKSREEEAQIAPPSLAAVTHAAKPSVSGVVSTAPVEVPKLAAPEVPAAPAAPKRIRVSQGVTQGMLVHQVKPQYPAMARETRVQGDVLLEAVIGKDGAVSDLQVISGPSLLIPSALRAVRQWRYKPYLLNGEPVEVETQIKLQFRL